MTSFYKSNRDDSLTVEGYDSGSTSALSLKEAEKKRKNLILSNQPRHKSNFIKAILSEEDDSEYSPDNDSNNDSDNDGNKNATPKNRRLQVEKSKLTAIGKGRCPPATDPSRKPIYILYKLYSCYLHFPIAIESRNCSDTPSTSKSNVASYTRKHTLSLELGYVSSCHRS